MARPKGIPFSEENSSANYAEFAVAKKPDGKLKMQKTLLMIFYAAFAVLYCTIFLVVVKMPALIAMLPLIVFIFYLCRMRPSTPSMISANAPKGIILTIFTDATSPTAYFAVNIYQGLVSSVLYPRDTRFFSASKLLTNTVIS